VNGQPAGAPALLKLTGEGPLMAVYWAIRKALRPLEALADAVDSVGSDDVERCERLEDLARAATATYYQLREAEKALPRDAKDRGFLEGRLYEAQRFTARIAALAMCATDAHGLPAEFIPAEEHMLEMAIEEARVAWEQIECEEDVLSAWDASVAAIAEHRAGAPNAVAEAPAVGRKGGRKRGA
jgi:hypothetical protein